MRRSCSDVGLNENDEATIRKPNGEHAFGTVKDPFGMICGLDPGGTEITYAWLSILT